MSDFSASVTCLFIDDGHLALRIWCKDDAGGIEQEIRYAVAVTIETTSAIPVYNEIQRRLRIRPRPAV
jgi:hypothetical protein